MIRPAALYNLGRFGGDSQMIGNVLRFLCGDESITWEGLSREERKEVQTIRNESEEMEKNAEKARAKKAAYREKKAMAEFEAAKKENATEVPACIAGANLKPSRPNLEMARYYAKQIDAESYLDEFLKIMEAQDWSYINPSGQKVTVGTLNFKTVLGAFYRRHKRSAAKKVQDKNEPYREGLAGNVGL